MRLGALRFDLGWSAHFDGAFERGLAQLCDQGAVPVDIGKGPDFTAKGRGLADRAAGRVPAADRCLLASMPPAVSTRSLADLVRFNRDNAECEMPLFGQGLFEQAMQAPGPQTPQPRKASAAGLRPA
ncbi:MAG: amidase, partial [Chitinophagaceae bacterium]|nr:amidase [Rubrivivax sp.]